MSIIKLLRPIKIADEKSSPPKKVCLEVLQPLFVVTGGKGQEMLNCKHLQQDSLRDKDKAKRNLKQTQKLTYSITT